MVVEPLLALQYMLLPHRTHSQLPPCEPASLKTGNRIYFGGGVALTWSFCVVRSRGLRVALHPQRARPAGKRDSRASSPHWVRNEAYGTSKRCAYQHYCAAWRSSYIRSWPLDLRDSPETLGLLASQLASLRLQEVRGFSLRSLRGHKSYAAICGMLVLAAVQFSTKAPLVRRHRTCNALIMAAFLDALGLAAHSWFSWLLPMREKRELATASRRRSRLCRRSKMP